MLVLLLGTQAVAADGFCNTFKSADGMVVTFGAPEEDQATVISAAGTSEVCDLDTTIQTTEPNYSERFDCGNGAELAGMVAVTGYWPDHMSFRGHRFDAVCD